MYTYTDTGTSVYIQIQVMKHRRPVIFGLGVRGFQKPRTVNLVETSDNKG